MKTRAICKNNVIVISAEASLSQAAKLMSDLHVGDLVVVEVRRGDRLPIGILTDRDIVRTVVAEGAPADSTPVAAVMTRQLITASTDEDMETTIEKMVAGGVRRVPVLGARGELCGIVSIDDFYQIIVQELRHLTSISALQIDREQTPAYPNNLESFNA